MLDVAAPDHCSSQGARSRSLASRLNGGSTHQDTASAVAVRPLREHDAAIHRMAEQPPEEQASSNGAAVEQEGADHEATQRGSGRAGPDETAQSGRGRNYELAPGSSTGGSSSRTYQSRPPSLTSMRWPR